jgi:hypothetical protein
MLKKIKLTNTLIICFKRTFLYPAMATYTSSSFVAFWPDFRAQPPHFLGGGETTEFFK